LDPQVLWTQRIAAAAALPGITPQIKSVLTNIAENYTNAPRKKAKFLNFVTNSCRIRAPAREWAAASAAATATRACVRACVWDAVCTCVCL
jgi:hypothetical protein